MRDLLTDPLWRADDLGRPLPDSPHACSVCLPTWAGVIGYEEGDPAVVGRMEAGYPRFFCHPQVSALFAGAAREKGGPGEKALVFPSPEAAAAAADWILTQSDAAFAAQRRIGAIGTTAVIFPPEAEKTARLYWRFSGQIVSSRLAEALLSGWGDQEFAAAETAGEAARTTIRGRLSALSGQPAENVFLFASGMAAVFSVQRALSVLLPGRRTVQLGFPYVDVLKVQEAFGSGVHFLPGVGEPELNQLEALAAAEPLAAIYTELPSNPLLETADLARVAAIARTHGIPLVADDTVATVVNIDAFAHADVVTTSLTKAFSGAGDVMAGAVIVSGGSPWADVLRPALARYQAAAPLFGLDAVVLEENSRDFVERVGRMNATALAVATWLAGHPAIARVHYPTFDGRAAYEALGRIAGTDDRGRPAPGHGYGMLLSFTLKDEAATPAFFDRLRISKGPSLGTNFSIACPYTLLAHYTELSWAADCGVSAHLVRLSIGLESATDLISRLAAALAPG